MGDTIPKYSIVNTTSEISGIEYCTRINTAIDTSHHTSILIKSDTPI